MASSLGFLRQALTRRGLNFLVSRMASTQAPKVAPEKLQQQQASIAFRTSLSNPFDHTSDQEGLYYSIPDAHLGALFSMPTGKESGIPGAVREQWKTFGEACIMVRRPALQVIDYLKTADLTQPPNCFLFYGPEGSGKQMTMAHVLHYGLIQKMLIIHIPFVRAWISPLYTGVKTASSWKENRVDLATEGVNVLTRFKQQNATFLAEQKPKIENAYKWTQREDSPAGTSFLDLIDFGIRRSKFSCDVVGALFKEIKLQSAKSKWRVLVLAGAVNAAWEQPGFLLDRKPVLADQISLIRHLKKLLRRDWTGASLVASVCPRGKVDVTKRTSYMPKYLLTDQGFEHLDPLLPICVPNYSEKEAISAVNYYIDQRWILREKARTDNGRRELISLSCYNPAELNRLASVL